MDNNRLVLHTVHEDNGATEVYWARANDDFLIDVEGSFQFFKDGTASWKCWTDAEVPVVVAIQANRVVVRVSEDVVGMTEINQREEHRKEIVYDSANEK